MDSTCSYIFETHRSVSISQRVIHRVQSTEKSNEKEGENEEGDELILHPF